MVKRAGMPLAINVCKKKVINGPSDADLTTGVNATSAKSMSLPAKSCSCVGVAGVAGVVVVGRRAALLVTRAFAVGRRMEPLTRVLPAATLLAEGVKASDASLLASKATSRMQAWFRFHMIIVNDNTIGSSSSSSKIVSCNNEDHRRRRLSRDKRCATKTRQSSVAIESLTME
jgi:hypothetical protein